MVQQNPEGCHSRFGRLLRGLLKFKEKGESELWLEIPIETRLSKEFLYANLRYKFVDDNPASNLNLQKPLIEINGERLTSMKL